MTPETEPVGPDEWLLRLVWETKYRDGVVASAAFEPLPGDTDGLSLFREACLADPLDVLRVIAEEKRPNYALVRVSVQALTDLGLTVRPAPIPEVPGHVVVPELTITAHKTDKSRYLPARARLAELASGQVVRLPGGGRPPVTR
jgi:hypothetical protein